MIEIQFSPAEIASYKRRFNHQLEPIKVMLVKKKSDLLKQEWLEFTDRTRKSVLEHPHQYLKLEENHPGTTVLDHLINTIFDEFISQMKFK